MLPSLHSFVLREPVLDKQQLTARLEDAAHLFQGFTGIGNRAKRPGDHYCIDAAVVQRNEFRRSPYQLRRNAGMPASRHGKELRMRLDAKDLCCTLCIERKIQARADADLQHATVSVRQYPLSIRIVVSVAHRKVDQMWQDAFLVETHRPNSIEPCVPEGVYPGQEPCHRPRTDRRLKSNLSEARV